MKTIQPTLCRRGALLCAGAVLLVATGAQAQTLNLYASSLATGTITDYTPGGSSIFASALNSPVLMASDVSGDVYVATGNGVAEFTPSGAETTLDSSLTGVLGVAVNASGDVFASSPVGITEIAPNGNASTFVADGNRPVGLAVNSAGDLFEADYNTGAINEYNPGGAFLTTFASGLIDPVGLAFDSAGNLYATSASGSGFIGLVTKYAPNGSPTLFASSVANPNGIAVDAANNVFVAAYSGNTINEYAPDGTLIGSIPLAGVEGLAVPEPSTWAMMGLGAFGLFRLRRKQ